MRLSQSEFERYIPLKQVLVDLQESKYMIKTPEGLKELILIEAWDNYVDTKNRCCVVISVPENIGTVGSFGEYVPYPKDCIEVGDIIIPDHHAIVQALDLVNDTQSGNYVQVDEKKYPLIYIQEISAVVKNGILWGMPHVFLAKHIMDPERKIRMNKDTGIMESYWVGTNKAIIYALPYGYDGEVKVGDTVIMSTNICYHIESPMYRSLPEDLVRIYVDNVIAVEEYQL